MQCHFCHGLQATEEELYKVGAGSASQEYVWLMIQAHEQQSLAFDLSYNYLDVFPNESNLL
jgi:hypothetical protein